MGLIISSNSVIDKAFRQEDIELQEEKQEPERDVATAYVKQKHALSYITDQ